MGYARVYSNDTYQGFRPITVEIFIHHINSGFLRATNARYAGYEK